MQAEALNPYLIAPTVNRAEQKLQSFWIAFSVVAHMFLGLLMFQVELVATVHALATLVVGLWWAVNGRQERVMYIGAYIVGAEVLWRMTQAQVFWEYGKYALSLLFILTLVRRRRIKIPLLPVFYFVLLLPSIWLTTEYLEPGIARGFISFNLSGPLALLVCAWFFYYAQCTIHQLSKMLIVLISPVCGIAAITIFSTYASSDIVFSSVSNMVTSGSFGPNQVSAMLGLGSVLLFFYLLFNREASKMLRGGIIGLLLLFVFQSALTFSRGGVAMAFGSCVMAAVFLFRDRRSRVIIIVIAILLYLFSQYIMLPFLDDFTSGAFTQRYTDTSTTGRDEIALTDLKLWQEHPILGVGPGRSTVFRELIYGFSISTHTEFTRLAADHGILGITALILLFLMSWRNFRKAMSVKGRAFFVALLCWTFLFMLVNAFRLAAPAFTFGFTFATLLYIEGRHSPPKTTQPLYARQAHIPVGGEGGEKRRE